MTDVAVKVRVTINRSAFVRVVGKISDRSAYKAAQKVRSLSVQNINALGRVHTGRMKDTIRVRKATTSVPESAAYTIASQVPYAKFQEFGTRAHGPRTAPFLVFRIRGKGPLIFAKWVRGVTPGRFMSQAAKGIRISDFVP